MVQNEPTAMATAPRVAPDLSLQSVLTQRSDLEMNREANRLASFVGWPFQEDCACTPLRMAQAGFYYCPADNEPDLARCYVCFKELTGWEPNDDPAEEHARSLDCAFVQLRKTEAHLTVGEFLRLEKARFRNRFAKLVTWIEVGAVEKRAEIERAAAARSRKR
ncbi:unnamed protein product [Ixodes hexagonus]